jgi:D-alanyl-D-alanine carboxypeptidase (penicillin-binding protein 5/6)
MKMKRPVRDIRWRHRLTLTVLGLMTAILAVSVVNRLGPSYENASAYTAQLTPPKVKARGAVVIDRDTGDVLYARNANKRLHPASLTKVMTALLVLGHVRNLDSYVRVPFWAVGQRGVNIGLQQDDRITVRNLLRCSLTKGASDCAVTLAYYVAGSEKAFVAKMNAKAKRLGLTRTHFENSSGVMDVGHLSSALDLARLTRVAMRNARFRPFVAVWQAHVRWSPGHDIVVHSRNWLVRYYSWGDGVKTGNSPDSGICMIGSGTYQSRALIVVTLFEPTLESERADVLKLFEYASQR